MGAMQRRLTRQIHVGDVAVGGRGSGRGQRLVSLRGDNDGHEAGRLPVGGGQGCRRRSLVAQPLRPPFCLDTLKLCRSL